MSVSTKLPPKFLILIFWMKFAPKGCFQSETGKGNNAIEFCRSKLV